MNSTSTFILGATPTWQSGNIVLNQSSLSQNVNAQGPFEEAAPRTPSVRHLDRSQILQVSIASSGLVWRSQAQTNDSSSKLLRGALCQKVCDGRPPHLWVGWMVTARITVGGVDMYILCFVATRACFIAASYGCYPWFGVVAMSSLACFLHINVGIPLDEGQGDSTPVAFPN